MKIIVDNREHTLIKLLKALSKNYKYQVEIEVAKMDVGDVAIHNDDGEELLILERKNLADLASSIKDGRYAEQSYRLNGYSLQNHNIIYLIEGNISGYSDRYSKIRPETLYVTMFCLNYFKGFSVFRTFGVTESAEYVLHLADKLRREKMKYGFYHSKFTAKPTNYVDVAKKVKKDNVTPDNITAIILSQIPGVSTKTAQVIMKEYRSLFELLKALDKDTACLDKLTFETDKGTKRRLSKTAIQNVIQYLFHQKFSVIKIDA